jgi:hypothetical protein
MKPFRTSGWPWLHKLEVLIPSTARGNFADDGFGDDDEVLEEISSVVVTGPDGEDATHPLPTPPSTSSTGKRKFSAVRDAASSSSDRKSIRSLSSTSTRSKVSTSAVISDAIENLTDSLKQSFLPQEVLVTDSLTKRSADAVTALTQSSLDVDDQLALISIFGDKPNLANLYLAIGNEQTRLQWVKNILGEGSSHGG